jgi:hypothetical protein
MLLILVSAITIALVVERITFAWVSLLFHLFNQGPDRKSTWFVGALVQNAVGLMSSIASAVSRLFAIGFKGLLFLTIVLILWGVASSAHAIRRWRSSPFKRHTTRTSAARSASRS